MLERQPDPVTTPSTRQGAVKKVANSINEKGDAIKENRQFQT
jgi:hypothetical protein